MAFPLHYVTFTSRLPFILSDLSLPVTKFHCFQTNSSAGFHDPYAYLQSLWLPLSVRSSLKRSFWTPSLFLLFLFHSSLLSVSFPSIFSRLKQQRKPTSKSFRQSNSFKVQVVCWLDSSCSSLILKFCPRVLLSVWTWMSKCPWFKFGFW
jgi:hypothetical protein